MGVFVYTFTSTCAIMKTLKKLLKLIIAIFKTSPAKFQNPKQDSPEEPIL